MWLQFRANFAGRYIEMRMLRVNLSMHTKGKKRFQNGYGVVVWTGENDTKTISVDANLFENGANQLRFQCGQGLIQLRRIAELIYIIIWKTLWWSIKKMILLKTENLYR